MIDIRAALNLGEEALLLLEKIYQLFEPSNSPPSLADPASGGAIASPTSLLQIRRQLLAIHVRRHLVTELVASGKLTAAEAQGMVDAGAAPAQGQTSAGTPFANILAWLQANGPAISADIAAAIPVLLSFLTLFGA